MAEAAPAADAPIAAAPVVEEPSPVAPTAVAEPTPSPAPSWDPANFVRAAGAGGCYDCKPGEWSVAIEVRAGPVNGVGCAPAAERGASFVDAVGELDLSAHAGPAVTPGAAWAAPISGTGSCVLAAVSIPAGARFLGYAFSARDAAGSGSCLPGQECGIGEARWDGDPRPLNVGGAKVFWAVFENSSGNERWGELKVWFAPPSKEWRPGLPTR